MINALDQVHLNDLQEFRSYLTENISSPLQSTAD
jgi:hypothetical protein